MSDELCQERCGFLFDHDCRASAEDSCQKCDKRVCGEHLHEYQEQRLCTSCARKLLKRLRRSDELLGSLGYDPYFYDAVYYRGYGHYGPGSLGQESFELDEHDPQDFTEADGASLLKQGSLSEDFEQDMEGS